MAVSAGRTNANIARAAGSEATSQASLRRTGSRLRAEVVRSRDEVSTYLSELGAPLERVLDKIVAGLEAKTHRDMWQDGHRVTVEVDDHRTQQGAIDLYCRLTGLYELSSDSAEDGPLSHLSDDELVALQELILREEAATRPDPADAGLEQAGT